MTQIDSYSYNQHIPHIFMLNDEMNICYSTIHKSLPLWPLLLDALAASSKRLMIANCCLSDIGAWWGTCDPLESLGGEEPRTLISVKATHNSSSHFELDHNNQPQSFQFWNSYVSF